MSIPLFKKLTHSAFTLAEVLIILTIIGVIAAMTVPTLMSKNKDQVTVTKLKKAQSVFANALTMSNITNGPIFDGYNWADTDDFKTIKDIFNQINTHKIIDQDQSEKIFFGGGKLLSDGANRRWNFIRTS